MRILMIVPLILSCDSSSPQMAQPDMADPCISQCTANQPTGTPLAMAFFDCMNTACQQYPADSAEQQKCISDAIDPSNPNAACTNQRNACFQGKIGGCKELADHIEQMCAPTTLPASDDEFGAAVFCVISEGWKGALAAQMKAWPLYTCVFSTDATTGCLAECQAGGAAGCRTCAQQKCGALYDACMADSSSQTSTDLDADKASCQTVAACALNCG